MTVSTAIKKKRRHIILLVLLAAITAAVLLSVLYPDTGVNVMGNLVVTSSAFEYGGPIPVQYTGKGEDKSPPLAFQGVDPLAETIAIVVEDPYIPFFHFTHWIVYNIPADITAIPEGIPHGELNLGGAAQGQNGFRQHGYMGPNPPFGTHTYRFIVYSMDTKLDLKPGAGRKQLEKAMQGHIQQIGLLEGTFGNN